MKKSSNSWDSLNEISQGVIQQRSKKWILKSLIVTLVTILSLATLGLGSYFVVSELTKGLNYNDFIDDFASLADKPVIIDMENVQLHDGNTSVRLGYLKETVNEAVIDFLLSNDKLKKLINIPEDAHFVQFYSDGAATNSLLDVLQTNGLKYIPIGLTFPLFLNNIDFNMPIIIKHNEIFYRNFFEFESLESNHRNYKIQYDGGGTLPPVSQTWRLSDSGWLSNIFNVVSDTPITGADLNQATYNLINLQMQNFTKEYSYELGSRQQIFPILTRIPLYSLNPDPAHHNVGEFNNYIRMLSNPQLIYYDQAGEYALLSNKPATVAVYLSFTSNPVIYKQLITSGIKDENGFEEYIENFDHNQGWLLPFSNNDPGLTVLHDITTNYSDSQVNRYDYKQTFSSLLLNYFHTFSSDMLGNMKIKESDVSSLDTASLVNAYFIDKMWNRMFDAITTERTAQLIYRPNLFPTQTLEDISKLKFQLNGSFFRKDGTTDVGARLNWYLTPQYLNQYHDKIPISEFIADKHAWDDITNIEFRVQNNSLNTIDITEFPGLPGKIAYIIPLAWSLNGP